ncbi:hypothetical protein [Rubellicoccus peritrichatus]|uniref:Uncharacterized protein n=1 Tax=Rubellicoccus peritrichatus TaxID=3080537 RepID=A0AAQ3L927_9BACT|nr:hypothetical protein [Puniceicoccus sp. CR14]WOO40887.1 hypothetical protein RZN69_19865 [Puniceicoccus sp. CR14]
MKSNPFYLVAGIGIGIFAYAIFAQIGRQEQEAPMVYSEVLDTTDVGKLKQRLEASQQRVERLESMMAVATMTESRLQQIQNPDGNPDDEITNFATLIDKAKPVLRELILPEIEANIANGDWDTFRQFDRWQDTLNLRPEQQERIQQQLDELSRQRAEWFVDRLKDDQTSMFSLFQETAKYENSGDPEVDAIFAANLDPNQLEVYNDERFTEDMQRVENQAANRLDQVVRFVPDLSESQQDEIYSIMARSSDGYRPEMQISIDDSQVQGNAFPLTKEQRSEEIEQILLPHQRGDWEAYQKREKLLSGLGDW